MLSADPYTWYTVAIRHTKFVPYTHLSTYGEQIWCAYTLLVIQCSEDHIEYSLIAFEAGFYPVGVGVGGSPPRKSIG